jgi:hypothetical protein
VQTCATDSVTLRTIVHACHACVSDNCVYALTCGHVRKCNNANTAQRNNLLPSRTHWWMCCVHICMRLRVWMCACCMCGCSWGLGCGGVRECACYNVNVTPWLASVAWWHPLRCGVRHNGSFRVNPGARGWLPGRHLVTWLCSNTPLVLPSCQ